VSEAVIYVLCDSRIADPVARIRYVGRTVNPALRMRAHQKTCSDGERTPRANWMRSVYRAGGDVLLEVVETTSRAGCIAAEIRWISHYRSAGSRLTNLTDGGAGLLNPSVETRRRIGDAMRGNTFWAGKRHTAESKAKMAAAHIGTSMHPNTRAAIGRPDVRSRIATTLSVRQLTPEELVTKRAVASRVLHTAAARDRQRASVTTPMHRAAISARQRSPEAIERIRNIGRANLGRKRSDAFRHACALRWCGRMHTAETKEKMSLWQRGADSHRAKLTWPQVCIIRERYAADHVSQRQLAREFLVQPRTINLIVHHKTWVTA